MEHGISRGVLAHGEKGRGSGGDGTRSYGHGLASGIAVGKIGYAVIQMESLSIVWFFEVK